MLHEIEVEVTPEFQTDLRHIKSQIARRLHLRSEQVKSFQIKKRSIDARGRAVKYRLRVVVGIEETIAKSAFEFNAKNVSNAREVHIIGSGPAGLFAALECIENGLRPVIFEGGKDVRARRRDLARINRQGLVNRDSNYCFGEGGAGTYSDGKLYTRSNKRGDVERILQLLVMHGADPDILIDARPHIGTNKLPGIIESIRQTITGAGGSIYFETYISDIEVAFGSVKSVITRGGDRIPTSLLVLATGHSSRGIYQLFAQNKWRLESKGFALGVRIEHPQSVIDCAQYKSIERSPFLPPAYYNLVHQVNGRGVFSFCMCPGGIIAPCATAPEEIVVNGRSPSKRNNPFANSGMVVQLNSEDLPKSFDKNDPLALLEFQHQIEKAAFLKGGGGLKAPGQRMVDYVSGKQSADLPANSYRPGLTSCNLDEILPNVVATSLKVALPVFGKKMKGYYSNEAVLVAVESRTSAPRSNPSKSRHI